MRRVKYYLLLVRLLACSFFSSPFLFIFYVRVCVCVRVSVKLWATAKLDTSPSDSKTLKEICEWRRKKFVATVRLWLLLLLSHQCHWNGMMVGISIQKAIRTRKIHETVSLSDLTRFKMLNGCQARVLAHTHIHTHTYINWHKSLHSKCSSFFPHLIISWNFESSIYCWTTRSLALRWCFHETNAFYWLNEDKKKKKKYQWQRIVEEARKKNKLFDLLAILLRALSTFFSDSMIQNSYSTFSAVFYLHLNFYYFILSMNGVQAEFGGWWWWWLVFSIQEKLWYFCLRKDFCRDLLSA